MSQSPEQSLEVSTENHRFYLAVVLVVGMVLIISIPAAGANYASAKDLAAIFSGWVTAVVGFYFLQQSTERAQKQTQEATKEAGAARKDAVDAAKKTTSLAEINETSILEFQTTIAKYKKQLEELVKTLEEEA